jgi:hypothetical protein
MQTDRTGTGTQTDRDRDADGQGHKRTEKTWNMGMDRIQTRTWTTLMDNLQKNKSVESIQL